MTRPDATLIGALLDSRYRIVELVGSGGMGTVYKARHVDLGAWRAIKVMQPGLAQRPEFVERFKREARLLEGLRHPNLVAVHDFGPLPDGGFYLVSEFVEGETLAAVLAREGALLEHDAAAIARMLAHGLAEAHAHGVVHRDIAPDNVMITGSSPALRVKLLDFGVAKDVVAGVAGETGTGQMFGKLGYAAPEQMGMLRAEEPVDPRADVFSLAAVLYRMLTGHLPWRADVLPAYLHDLLFRPESELHARIEADLPPTWHPCLKRALARQRDRRTPTMEAFRADLPERPAAQDTRRRDPVSVSSRGIVASAGVAAVLLVAGLGWSFARRSTAARDTPPPTSAGTATVETTPTLPPAPPEATPTPRDPPPNPRPNAAAPVPIPRPPPVPSEERASGPELGLLLLKATPEADVYIDGERRGHTPAALRLTAGRHGLLLITDDGRRYADELELTAGATLDREHRFSGFGALSIASEPWMEIVVDDGSPQQTPLFIAKLPAGKHVIRARRRGFKDLVQEVDVQESLTTSVRLTPQREGSSESDFGSRRDVRVSTTSAPPKDSFRRAFRERPHGFLLA